ncbi:MAG: NAD-dependent DNA ligase LigA [Candidatus Hodarchaeota archaeon]
MNKPSNKKSAEIKKLADQILYHKRKYYEGEPVLSDASYDALEEKLRELDPEHPVLYIVGPPMGGKITHDTPMLSCQKATEIEEVLKWSKGFDLFVGYKIDGFSLSLIYENGKLIQAATRGNGITGDDTTIPAMKISSIPKLIPEMSRINIRGELFMKISEFNRINQQEGINYSSPRNLAVGTIKQKDIGLLEKRKLEFSAFELLGYNDEADLLTKTKFLKSWNFQSADFTLLKSPSAEDITNLFKRVENKRSTLDFEIDGIILKYNDAKARQNAGSTEHHPKWMMALKFESQGKLSTVNDITWQVGRLGIITPVAELEPVEVMGALIRRATLHNAEFVETLDIGKGDKILVVRSGDVIPKITEIIEKGDKHAEFPSNCPSCNSLLKRDGVNLICAGSNCREKEIQKIHHWVKNVDIVGLGLKNVTKLYDSNLIKHFADLYNANLTEGKLVSLFGKNGSKIFYNIQNSRKIPLHIFLAGLGIENLGRRMSKTLTQHFKNYQQLKNATISQLVQIDGISDTIANSIVNGLKDPSLGDKVLSNGVQIVYGKVKKKKDKKSLGSLMDFLSSGDGMDPSAQYARKNKSSKDLKVYVTGKVANATKKDIQRILEENGYEWAPVTKKLDLLITGEDPGLSKLDKARKYGIKIITWAEFSKEKLQN